MTRNETDSGGGRHLTSKDSTWQLATGSQGVREWVPGSAIIFPIMARVLLSSEVFSLEEM